MRRQQQRILRYPRCSLRSAKRRELDPACHLRCRIQPRHAHLVGVALALNCLHPNVAVREEAERILYVQATVGSLNDVLHVAVAEVIVDKAVRFVYVCTLEVVVEVFVKCAFGLCLNDVSQARQGLCRSTDCGESHS